MVLGVGSVRAYSYLRVRVYYEFSHHLKLFWCGPSFYQLAASIPVGSADLVVMVIITNVPREIFEVG